VSCLLLFLFRYALEKIRYPSIPKNFKELTRNILKLVPIFLDLCWNITICSDSSNEVDLMLH
jgi:hypothetical protein